MYVYCVEGGASASQVERTHDRATLTSWVVGPLHSYTQEGWVDNNNNKHRKNKAKITTPRGLIKSTSGTSSTYDHLDSHASPTCTTQHITKQQHHPSYMETSKHHTISFPKHNKDMNIGTSYRPISLLSVIAKHWRRHYSHTSQTSPHLQPKKQIISLDDIMVYNDVAKECVRQWIGLV